MSYIELIEKLKQLPAEKQGAVFDFVAFLSSKNGTQENTSAAPSHVPVLAAFRAQPLLAPDFVPLSRMDANAR